MLRNAVIALGAVAFTGGLIALVTGTVPPGFIFAFWGLLLILGTVYERVRYKPVESAAPAGNWVRTEERFIDETGLPVTVYMEPETGERKYVRG